MCLCCCAEITSKTRLIILFLKQRFAYSIFFHHFSCGRNSQKSLGSSAHFHFFVCLCQCFFFFFIFIIITMITSSSSSFLSSSFSCEPIRKSMINVCFAGVRSPIFIDIRWMAKMYIVYAFARSHYMRFNNTFHSSHSTQLYAVAHVLQLDRFHDRCHHVYVQNAQSHCICHFSFLLLCVTLCCIALLTVLHQHDFHLFDLIVGNENLVWQFYWLKRHRIDTPFIPIGVYCLCAVRFGCFESGSVRFYFLPIGTCSFLEFYFENGQLSWTLFTFDCHSHENRVVQTTTRPLYMQMPFYYLHEIRFVCKWWSIETTTITKNEQNMWNETRPNGNPRNIMRFRWFFLFTLSRSFFIVSTKRLNIDSRFFLSSCNNKVNCSILYTGRSYHWIVALTIDNSDQFMFNCVCASVHYSILIV